VHRRIGLGLGERYPDDHSRVTFHFIERDSEGRPIASTYAAKNTVTLPVNRLIDGLREGVQMMRKAERRLFVIPAELVNRVENMPINQSGHYVFEVQLFAFSSTYP
jgi:FKBP-type peptidyl-prolyl cis-trans isomerase